MSGWAIGSARCNRWRGARCGNTPASRKPCRGCEPRIRTYSWKFDNYVRSASPYQFNLQDAEEIWSRIECPTLLLRGSESWTMQWDDDDRTRAFRNARVA